MASNHDSSSPDWVFVSLFAVFQAIFAVLFCLCVDYNTLSTQGHANGADAAAVQGTVTASYSYYTDVSMMIFIGFGFLMTFLRRYAHSAIGYTFMLSCFVIQMCILVEGFFDKVHDGHGIKGDIMIDVTHLIRGLFAAGAVMISFGAVIGRASPTQLLVMSILEVVLYCLNEFIGAGELQAIDMGGSMFVHSFGAYFGLAASMVLSRGKGNAQDKDNASRYDSDVSAMLGTIVLWVLWPSFNGALAPTPDSQIRVVLNTVLALSASTTWAFLLSHVVHKGKFKMVHVQNATLAGGIAIGSSSDLVVGPGGALLIGGAGGMLSVLGYHYLQPLLHRALGLQDTCGVHNLHGLPGILGALTGALTCGLASTDVYGASFDSIFPQGRTPETQWPKQILALLITLGISLVGGAVAGGAMRATGAENQLPYKDDEHWLMEEEQDEEEGGAASTAAAKC